MSRAFIKEDAAAEDVIVTHRPPLPAGVENLVTPAGLAALTAELKELQAELNRVSGSDSATEEVRRLAALDEEIPELEERLSSAVLVPTPPAGTTTVLLGATVTIEQLSGPFKGQSTNLTIVGVDEADALEGLVAFTAPVAQALLGQHLGAEVSFHAGDDEQRIKVAAVAYRAQN